MSSDLTFITNEHGKNLGDRFSVMLGDDTTRLIAFVSALHALTLEENPSCKPLPNLLK